MHASQISNVKDQVAALNTDELDQERWHILREIAKSRDRVNQGELWSKLGLVIEWLVLRLLEDFLACFDISVEHSDEVGDRNGVDIILTYKSERFCLDTTISVGRFLTKGAKNKATLLISVIPVMVNPRDTLSDIRDKVLSQSGLPRKINKHPLW